MSRSPWRRIISRLIEAAATLLALAALTFLLMKALPGSPFDQDVSLHPVVQERLSKEWALSESTPRQLIAYLGSAAQGDLGWSLSQPGRSVGEMIATGFSRTFWLNVFALVTVLLLAPCLAALALVPALRGFMDALLLALISLPGLFLGPLLIWFFAFYFEWLPAAFLESPAHYILPVLTLSLRPSASVARLLLASLREISSQDFLRTAKAKGLSAQEIFWRHALRNSLIPALAYMGPVVVGLLSGSFIVEILFSTQGLGVLFVEALGERDLPVVLGVSLCYGLMLITVSFLIDLLSVWIDPRISEVSS